jgi:hypothetical protein
MPRTCRCLWAAPADPALGFIADNPYSKEPGRSLWDKGHRQARREWDAKRPARRPFNKPNRPRDVNSSRFVNVLSAK